MRSQPVAVIGVGLTGAPLAEHLSRSHPVIVWDIDPAKLSRVSNQKVEVAGSAGEAAKNADRLIIDLFDDDAVRACCTGPDGLITGVRPGATVIDLSTTSLETKLWLQSELGERRARLVEAPFCGSVDEISRGSIWTVVGCDEDVWPEAQTLLESFSRATRIGDVGAATRFKLAANVLTFSMVQLIAEAIALARALHVDPQTLLDVIADGTGVRAPIYQVKGRAMVAEDFEPRATVGLARKDLQLILEAAAESDLDLPLTEATKRQFDAAARAGWGNSDMARVFQLLDGSAND